MIFGRSGALGNGCVRTTRSDQSSARRNARGHHAVARLRTMGGEPNGARPRDARCRVRTCFIRRGSVAVWVGCGVLQTDVENRALSLTEVGWRSGDIHIVRRDPRRCSLSSLQRYRVTTVLTTDLQRLEACTASGGHAVSAILPDCRRLPIGSFAIRLWCGPVWSVFLSVPHALRIGIYEGLGTPRPCCAVGLLPAAAARGIGVDGASCGKAIHRVSHCPKALGALVGAMADVARGERAGEDRVARSEVLTLL